MAIIAVVAVLGIAGFTSFRRSIQFTESINEVLAVVKETRNQAKNNVLPKEIVANSNRLGGGVELLYAYNLNFQNNTMTRVLCNRASGTTSQSWTCDSSTAEDLKSQAIFGQIDYDVSASDACRDVLFENLTGDMKVRRISGVATYQEQDCSILVRQQESGNTREIEFDAVSNTFKLIGE